MQLRRIVAEPRFCVWRRLVSCAAVLFLTSLLGCFRQRVVEVKTMSLETEIYLIDIAAIESKVVPAIDSFLNHGDPAASDLLFREALSSDSFQALLRAGSASAHYFAREGRHLLDGRIPTEAMDDRTGEITTDPETIRRLQTEIVLARVLVLHWSARYPPGVPSGITLNRGALADYIRTRSKWIDDTLSLSNEFLWEASDLKPSIGGQAKLLTQGEANILLDALRKVPAPPESGLRYQYDNLILLAKTAAGDPRYRILIWIV